MIATNKVEGSSIYRSEQDFIHCTVWCWIVH